MRGIKRECLGKKTLSEIAKPIIESGKYEESRKVWKEEFQREIDEYLNEQ